MENQEVNLNLSVADLFHPKKAELIELAKQYKDIKINWVDDKEWYRLAMDAKTALQKARTNIEKTRLDYTRQFDQKKKDAMELEKELLKEIVPTEDMLQEQIDAVKKEQDRIKKEKEEAEAKIIQDRFTKLQEYGFTPTLLEMTLISEEDFEVLLSEKKKLFDDAESIRIEEENKAKALKEKEDKERADFAEEQKKFAEDKAKQEAEMKAKQDKIDADNKAIEDEKNKLAREKEMEEFKKKTEQEAKARAEENARLQKLEDEKKAKEEKEAKEKADKESQVKLEKEKKYKKWIEDNKGTWDFYRDIDGERQLCKIISSFKIG